MSFTNTEDAINAIVNVGSTKNDIIDFVRQLAVDAPGSTTVLYSGPIFGTPAWQIVNSMTDVRHIGTTMAAEVLNSDEFKAKVAQAFGYSRLQDFLNAPNDAPGKIWLNKGGTGPWATVSEMFVDATTGPVKILTQEPLDDSVFIRNEVPKLAARLRSGEIEEIAGTLRETLLAAESAGDDIFHQIVRAAKIDTVLAKPQIGETSIFLTLNEASRASRMQVVDGDNLGLVQKVLRDHPFSSGVVKRLPLLGQGLAILGALHVAMKAEDARAEGRPDEALHLIQDYGAEMAGSSIGQVAGGVLATIGLVLAGVAVANPVGIAVILAATVAGGYFGGEAGVELAHLFQDRSEEQARDISARMLKLVFGDNYSLESPVPAELTTGSLTVDTTFSREDMVVAARGNIAWRYALRELNPFVIAGDALYAKHNTDGSLDLYNQVTGEGSMTDLYLQDRAAMLTWKLRYDQENKSYSSEYNTTEINGNWDFVDLTSGVSLAIDGVGISLHDHQIVFGAKNADTISGKGDLDHLYGAGGNDSLSGLGGADYLEGGTDNDTLDGGTGDDTLMGGSGSDTYIFRSGDGKDTVVDFDTGDSLRIGNDTLSGGEETTAGSRIWQSTDKRYRYVMQSESDGSQSLVILSSTASDQITVRNFTNGRLGITIDGLPAPTRDQPSTTIIGDRAPIDADPNEPGVQTRTDALGNIVTDPNQPEPGRSDALYDSSGDDLIQGLEGADGIYAQRGGNDRLEAGAGDDYVEGGAGDDTILGGSGVDILRGDADDDRLYAAGDVALSISDAILLGRSQAATHQRGDWLSGGKGSDVVIGGADDDVLFGGAGSDVLVGGGGDDVMDGSDDYVATDRAWTITVPASGNIFDRFFSPIHNFNEGDLRANAGTDLLYGGAGNDFLYGGDGDDFLRGEADNDTLAGSGGDDVLHGGSGDDRLTGDTFYLNWEGGVPPPTGNDRLFGEAGADILYGEAGDDLLSGGTGDDTVRGEDGNDTYLYALGDGKDTLIDIYVAGETNTLQLGEGLHANKVLLSVSSEGYALTMSDSGVVKLQGNFAASNVGEDQTHFLVDLDKGDIQRVVFGDGSTMGWGELAQRGFTQVGTAAQATVLGTQFNDTVRAGSGASTELRGGAGNDTLQGGAGNDTLNGGSGHDALEGGNGNDSLQGGVGDDVYTYALGDGNDTITDNTGSNTLVLSGGVIPEGVSARRTAADLILRIESTGGEITVKNWGASTGARLSAISFSTGTSWTMAQVNQMAFAQPLTGSAGDDTLAAWEGEEGAPTLAGGLGNDTYIVQTATYKVFENSNEGDDTVQSAVDYALSANFERLTLVGSAVEGYGNALNNMLTGNAQANYLVGAAGDDILIGGAGDDTLEGGSGANVYRLYSGDGHDEIRNSNNLDVIQFGAGITASNLRATRTSSGLLLGYGYGNDEVLIAGGTLGAVQFFDGSSRTLEQLFPEPSGGTVPRADSDEFWRTNVSFLRTGSEPAFNGGNAWQFNLGQGVAALGGYSASVGGRPSPPPSDTVQFGLGIEPSMLSLGTAPSPSDGRTVLLLRIGQSDDALRLRFDPTDAYRRVDIAEYFRFSDGNYVTYADLVSRGFDIRGSVLDEVITGTDTVDRISAFGGNDTLSGGQGDDVLDGGAGNDVYEFGRGDGADRIQDFDLTASNSDMIQFASSVLPGHVTVSRSGDDLRITISDTGDSLVLSNWYVSDAYKIEKVKFADNVEWDARHLQSQAPLSPIIGTEDNDILYAHGGDGGHIEGLGGDDTLIGGDARDILEGGAGKDVLTGGAGDDSLIGGADDDIYSFSVGDGADTIDDSAGVDLVEFNQGITVSAVAVSRMGSLVTVKYSASDSVNFIETSPGQYSVESFKFADGTHWLATDIRVKSNSAATGAMTISGTPIEHQTLTAVSTLSDADGLGALSYQWQSSVDNGSTWVSVGGATASTFVPTQVQVGQLLRVNASYTDGRGTVESKASAATATVTNVNDAPTATNLSTAETYTEDVALNLVDIVASDVDHTSLSVTLTLSNVAAGSLNTGTSGAVTSTYNANTGVWTASGATASVNALLAALTFTPGANFNGNFNIATSVSDGVAAAVTGSKSFTGVAVNDTPTGAVTVNGTATQNQTLTATDTLADVDGMGAVAYQWQSSADSGVTWSAISGATTSSFVLTEAQVGKQVRVNASYTDEKGTVESKASAATATVTNVNDAPTATNLSTAETYTEDVALNLVDIVASDVDHTNLSVTLTLSNVAAGSLNTGTSGAVTSTYNASTGVWTASGATASVNALLAALTLTPGANFNGNFNIATSVSDGVAAAVTGSKSFTGVAVNDAPSGASAIPGQKTQVGAAFSWGFDADSFVDPEGQALTYAVQLAGGAELPAWLSFDPATRSFSGTPPTGASGSYTISVVATDPGGEQAQQDFVLEVAPAQPTNHAPEVALAPRDQMAVETWAFSYVLPAATFADADAGDTLSYTATLSDGTPLPSWLHFDAHGLTLSGTPSATSAGVLDVVVTATDPAQASATASFKLDIANYIEGTANSETLVGTSGRDVILGKAGSDNLKGNAGDDVFLIEGEGASVNYGDRFEGGEGYDVIQGGAGDDTIRVYQYTGVATVEKIDGGAGVNIIAGTSWHDTIDLSGTAELVNIARIEGGSGEDKITGNAQANVIVGGANQDAMAGGGGDDVFLIEGEGASVNYGDRFEGGEGYDVIQGGAGDDTIRVYQYTGAATVEKIDGGAGVNIIAGTSWHDTIDLSGTAELVNIARIEGGSGEDKITGNAQANVIVGGANQDAMAGGGGDDVFLIEGEGASVNYGDRFEGGEGYDVIQGGAGDDTIRVYQYTGAATVEKIDGGAGVNIIAGTSWHDTIDLSGTAELVNIARIEGGSGEDKITGNAQANVIVGGANQDAMAGGGGDDVFLIEGEGASVNYGDRFEGGEGYDVIQGGAGDDTIRVYQYTGAATVEKIDGGAGVNIIAGTSWHDTIDLSGTAELVNIARIEGDLGNDKIIGNAQANVIVGGAGWDDMRGGGGDDVFLIEGEGAGTTYGDRFEGGEGYDVIQGGAGDDTIRVGQYEGVATVEKIDGGAGVNIVAGTSWHDTIDLTGTVELVNIARIEGGLGNDKIIGNAQANVIVGGAGWDDMRGGGGDDVFLIEGEGAGTTYGDRFEGGEGYDVIQGGAGDDTIRVGQYEGVATVEKIDGGAGVNIVAGTSWHDTIDLTGTVELVNIARIEGDLGNDKIIGNAQANVIVGGAGWDDMRGGGGDDVFLIEGEGAGTTYGDRFEGGEGYDVIQGGVGDDMIRVGQYEGAATVEKIDGGAGVNIVAGTSWHDTIDLTGTVELVNIARIEGGLGNDKIIGNAQANVIVGGAGWDDMRGGGGDDVFLIEGEGAGTTYGDRFEGGEGYDVIQGGVGDDMIRVGQYEGAATVEKIDGGAGVNIIAGTVSHDTIDLSGTAELVNIARIEGGSGEDRITGNAQANVIVGGADADDLRGGGGDDVFLFDGDSSGYAERIEGGDGYDVIQGGAGDDTIRVGQYTGVATVEKIDGGAGVNVLAGSNATHDTIDLTGTELVNIARIEGGLGNDKIIGSAQADVIVGGAGWDDLRGGGGDDVFLFDGDSSGYAERIEGGDGYDVIQGGAGDDTIRVAQYTGVATVEKIDGGAGVNVLAGSNSTHDTIDLTGTELVNIARIEGGQGDDKIIGSAQADVIVGGAGWDDLRGGGGDDVFLFDGDSSGYAERIEGGDGYDVIQGGAGDDTIRVGQYTGVATVEKIDGGAGVNVLAGSNSTHDTIDLTGTELVNIARIEGGQGDDKIIGSAQANVIVGGAGWDTLRGGAGDDSYHLARGDGADSVLDDDTTAGNTDKALFGSDIAFDQLWFRRLSDNLEVSIIGTGNRMTIEQWFTGSQYHIEEFKAGDGKTLLESQVQNLVDAMASFAPPAAGQTTMPDNYRTKLDPVLAANWS